MADDRAFVENAKRELKKRWNFKIDIRLHAKLKSMSEQINEEEVKENLRNPDKLAAVRQIDKFKFILYFKLSNTLVHKYIVDFRDFEKTIRIVTVVKLRIKWQKGVEKYVR